MVRETKIIHVHLIFKKVDKYFGSKKAIFSIYTADEIGMTEETLMHKKLEVNSVILTKKAIIKCGTLITCSRK